MIEINGKIWNYLKKSFEKKKFSHAYIFCGPEKTGKFDMAKKFVELINNENFNLASRNIIVIESAVEKKEKKERKKDISIEQTREAIKKAGYFADGNKKKFLIIKDADKLSHGASNSLLKIIEEPKNDTIVILLCEREEKLLLTIRSRCQNIFFNLLPVAEIKRFLTQKFPDLADDRINDAAIYCRGKHKLALDLAQNEELLKEKKEVFDIFRKTIKTNWFEALNVAEALSKNKEKLLETIDEWIWSLNEFLRDDIKNKSDKKIDQRILAIIKNLLEAKEKIQNSNASEKIQLENFFIKTI